MSLSPLSCIKGVTWQSKMSSVYCWVAMYHVEVHQFPWVTKRYATLNKYLHVSCWISDTYTSGLLACSLTSCSRLRNILVSNGHSVVARTFARCRADASAPLSSSKQADISVINARCYTRTILTVLALGLLYCSECTTKGRTLNHLTTSISLLLCF